MESRKTSRSPGKNSANTIAKNRENEQEKDAFTLDEEIDWCVKRLEIILREKKLPQKKVETLIKAVDTLKNKNSPLPSKRMVMRQSIGDYRTLMKQERAKTLKEALPMLKTATPSVKGLVARKKQTVPDEIHKKEKFSFNFCIDDKILEKD